MKKIRRNWLIALLLVIAMMIGSVPAVAATSSSTTIRVGACTEFGISKVGNTYQGFAYDYLMALETYADFRYNFVEARPEELMEMLANGTIDVIPCITQYEYDFWTPQYFTDEVAPMLCEESLMKKFTAVYVYAKNKDAISYGDIEALNEATIGYLSVDASKYFSDGKLIRGEIDGANFVEYATEEQMKADFYSGKIDAVIKECFNPWEDEMIVYQYNTRDCYFLVSANAASLKAQLDIAVNSKCMTDSHYAAELYSKHIEKYGSVAYALSHAEKQYVQENPVITIAYNENSNALENFDNGKILGYTDSVLRHISDVSGLVFQVRACDSLDECVRLLADGQVQVVCGGVNSDTMAPFGNYKISNPYFSVPIVVSGKKGTPLNGNLKIAIPFGDDDISRYAAGMYKNATLLPYADIENCMEAVRNGDADVVCAGTFETAYIISEKYEDMDILATATTMREECFAYNLDCGELSSIFGKSIAGFGASEVAISYSDNIKAAAAAPDHGHVPAYVIYIVLALLVLVIIVALVNFVAAYLRRKQLVNIDSLTGGRSKSKFIEDTRKLIKKSSHEKWAIVLVDINKFKYINDRLGFEEGDRILERFYRTIADAVDREEVFARISDDNFAMTIHDRSEAELTTRISDLFAEFDRRNSLLLKYPVVFSAGVCHVKSSDANGDVDVNAILDRCIIAKKTLKGMHNSSIAFYDGKIREKALREKDYENIMPTALEQREFECYLQPKYGLKSRHIEGAEALIRWNSKEFGFVFPNEFIPLSEKNGFVVELDFFILEEVCRAMRRWIDEGKTPVVVSVNQSRMHLNYDDYIWRLREIVDRYDIPYQYIELELTESVFMENAEQLLIIVNKLHEIGFKLSIDDFGSGYSSLNMLKDIPVDVVKIDREFFNGTVNSERGRAVISTVVDLASNLDMQVISEGVETLEQVEFLTEINCAMVQGYYFARPMPIPSFEELWQKDIDMQRAEQE